MQWNAAITNPGRKSAEYPEMVNWKGVASYCQECGACAASLESAQNVPGLEPSVVDSIVDQVLAQVGQISPADRPDPDRMIPLGVSNRHMHITEATFARLFGRDAVLESYRDLYQSGEFAAKQTVTIVGSKMRAIQNVRILGPHRNYDQVELSLTDAVQLGIDPPIADSGDMRHAAPLTIAGPKASVYLERCAIIANRHIHMNEADAARLGVKDGDLARVRIGGDKSTLFENVKVRVKENYRLQLHLDTDDANAAHVRCDMKVEFLGI